MKLVLDKNNFTNSNYQLVPMYNARNVAQPTNILDNEVVDTETKVKYKLGQLLEIIEALKNETRERGVI